MKKIYLLLLSFVSQVAFAQLIPDANKIIYVRQGGTGNGNSWANATGDLQGAIDASGVSQAWVARGTYQPPLLKSFIMKHGVSIYGGFPNDNNNAGMADRNWAGNTTILRGNGSSVIENRDNVLTPDDILDGFTITGGSSSFMGGGIYNVGSSPSYINLIITKNRAVYGGDGMGISGASAAPRLTNVIIQENTGEYPSGVDNASSPVLTNVTIGGNAGREWYGPSGTPVIRNSIIYGNGVLGQMTDIQNSLVQNQTNEAYSNPANHNVPTNMDPLFVGPSWGNFQLLRTSPAIDKGNNAFVNGLNADTKDLAGNPRVFDFSNSGVVDMGAYEHQIATLIPDPNGVIYVSGAGSGDGHSWYHSTNDLQGAINATGVKQVRVSEGTYRPDPGQSFSMKQGVAIYGGFPNFANNNEHTTRDWAAYPATLLGNGNSVIKNEDNGLTPSDVLDGFIITGGAADFGAGIYNGNSSPSYSNLVITKNKANAVGGGMFIAGTSGSPRVTNVLINDNTALWAGGGVHNSISPVFTNVTISGNVSQGAGNEWNDYGNPVIQNSIIYGNGVNGELNNVQNSQVQNQTNAAYNNTSNSNLPTNADPLFADPAGGNYTLTVKSPGLNKGNNAFLEGLNIDTRDLAGKSRVFDAVVDMGAYERQILQYLPDANGIIYVRQDGKGKGNSWENAMADFQEAINTSGVKQVWTAEGTYQTALGQSFEMKQGVAIYGGFPDRDDNAGMDDRNWKTHVTTLKGNGNSVVKNVDNNLSATDILDGFTVTGGTASFGAGIHTSNSSPSYVNLLVTRNLNRQLARGGGVYIYGLSAAPKLTNMVVSTNWALQGGGVYIDTSSPILTNVLINDNSAGKGGGVYYRTSDERARPVFTNVTIADNYGGLNGAEWYNENGTPVIRNAIISPESVYGQLNDTQNSLVADQTNAGYTDLPNNNLPSDTDPRFVDWFRGNYSLKETSLAKDGGKNAFFNGLNADTKDLAGNPRLAGTSIDMGAYEFPDDPMPVRWVFFEGHLNDQHQAVLNWKTEETNVSHYDVERSANAKEFRVTTTVTADGNGSADYSLTDPVPVSGGVAYYRIRQVDLDGTFSYSRIISIKNESQQAVVGSFYPNPSRAKTMIDVNTAVAGRWTLTMTDASGRTVTRRTYDLQKGKNTISLEHFTQGINLIRFEYGQFSETRKLVRE